MSAIKQIKKHLHADRDKWDKQGGVYIAKHHYSRKQVQFIAEDSRSRYLTKLYTKEELKGVYKNLKDADRIDGDKWIIPPSQTKLEMKDMRVIQYVKRKEDIATMGGV